jgi:nicotinate phosphoribosyltransferase
VIDFGLRRMHGVDAALKGVKAYAIAGLEATSNVLGAMAYGLPVTGTMAHSYIQAHDDESQAFAAFVEHYPKTTLLVDTYDSIQGVRHVVELAKRLGPAFGVRAIRLDSGDLPSLARQARALLDEAGLHQVRIIASGGLTEQSVAAMMAAEVPVDAFAVGTHMGVSEDAPTLDLAYKMTSYRCSGRMKTAPGKGMFPGRHQVFRLAAGEHGFDVLALRDEVLEGEPLLESVLHDETPLAAEAFTVAACRDRAQRSLAALPAAMRDLAPAPASYPVHLSPALCSYRDTVQHALAQGLPPPVG